MKKVCVIIALLLFGCGNIFGQKIFEEETNLYSTTQLNMNAVVTNFQTLVIKSAKTLRGQITITTGSSDSFEATYYKKARTENKKRSYDYIDLITVSVETKNNDVILNMRSPNPAPWNEDEMGLVEINITVPEFIAVDINAELFDVSAKGPFSRFESSGSLGKYEVSNVKEKLVVHTLNRRLMIENIRGEIDASTSNSSLIGYDLECPHESININNDGGDIRLENVTGELNVRNKYGRIRVVNFKPRGVKHFIRGSYGPIDVGIISLFSGQLIVSNNFEDVELTVPGDLSAQFSLAVEEGNKIELTDFKMKPELVQPNRLYITTGDGTANINGSIRGEGNIYVRADYDSEE